MSVDAELRELAGVSRAWPFEEARRLLGRVDAGHVRGDSVLFETGYGPSGLPHIGTFGEVAGGLTFISTETGWSSFAKGAVQFGSDDQLGFSGNLGIRKSW